MTRNVAIRSWQAGTLLVAIVLSTTGCQSSPWSTPSFSSWSPFKSKDADASSLASAKPTSKTNVPPPVGSSASGSSSLASSRSSGSIPVDPMTRSSRYQRETTGESIGSPEASNRMASAMPSKDAYHTGPYSTGAGYRPYGNSVARDASPRDVSPRETSPRDGGDSYAAARPTSGSMANASGPPAQSGYGSAAERSSYSPSGYSPRVASNPSEERRSRSATRVSASVSDDAPSAAYPSTRTPNLPTALSNASNYRPGSVSRSVMPASFQNANARQSEASGSEEAPAVAESDASSDSIYR